ncbi:hypothetical protein BS47DRAFT_1350651 [Hydnum rufescens UP504]|uniref:Uncharacterized protein n=1 Tax=Hydnum rufescens UP504 TaxID=1448309 RepID=A0A9P6ALS5_9AGAM|nr:hypothetical protein BS47DRAFT_1350651 [Hydnum rufescens UP504]
MHSIHIFAFPELVCYIVSFLPTAHDRSHLSQCCSYMHELVLPMLYEDVAISFTSVSVIVTQLIARPNLARRCHTLWVKDPHYSGEIDYVRFSSLCSDLGSLLCILGKYGRLKSFVWHMPTVYASSLYDPVTVWNSLRCAASGLETIDIFGPYAPDFQLGPTMLKGDYSTLRSLHLQLQYDHWHGTTLAESIKNMQGLEELYLDGIDESMALSFSLPHLRLLSLSSGTSFSTQGILELCADLPKLRGLSMHGLCPGASLGVTSNLRCLEIHLSPSSFNGFLKILPEILQFTPSLIELGIYASSQWVPCFFLRFWTWHRIVCLARINVSSLKHALSLVALYLPDLDKNTVHLSTTIMDSSKDWPSQLRFIVCDKGRPPWTVAMGVKIVQRAPADYNWTKKTIIDHATGVSQMLHC